MFSLTICDAIGPVLSASFPLPCSPTCIEAAILSAQCSGFEVQTQSPLRMLIFEDDILIEDAGIEEGFYTALAFIDEPGFMGTIHVPAGNMIPTPAEARQRLA